MGTQTDVLHLVRVEVLQPVDPDLPRGSLTPETRFYFRCYTPKYSEDDTRFYEGERQFMVYKKLPERFAEATGDRELKFEHGAWNISYRTVLAIRDSELIPMLPSWVEAIERKYGPPARATNPAPGGSAPEDGPLLRFLDELQRLIDTYRGRLAR